MKSFIKKFIWRISGGYRPKLFWDNWANSFMEDEWQVQTHEQHEWILNKVNELKPKQILEVGCGFGRNIDYLVRNGYPAAQITGVDISSKMILKAKRFLKNKNITLLVADSMKLPFSSSAFDLILIHGVFMHIEQKNIDKSFQEVMRVSKKYIIQVEQNSSGNNYTFIHDYKKLYEKYRVKIIEYKRRKDLLLDFIYGKVPTK